jgi:hypothetical protein
MSRSVSIIDYKVQQADFFLQKLDACGHEFFAAQCYADAFVSTCRSITFSVQAVCKEVSGFESWYAEEQNRMKTDVLCVFFNKYRTANVHVGETPVLAGAGKQGEIRFFFMPTQDIPDVPELDVVRACHAYFKSVVDLVFRLYARFPTDLDDRWHYTKQHFDSKGLTIEDALESLGFLTSQDINQRSDSTPSRFIINFGDLDESKAKNYNLPFQRVSELVKPVRDKLTRQVHEACFWKHWDRRDDLYESLHKLKRALVMGRVSSQHAVAFMEIGWLPFDGVVVFLWDDFAHFGLLQCSVHEIWSDRFRTTLREDPRYSVSDCFVTFPMPSSTSLLAAEPVGQTYYDHRRGLMLARREGLTKTYNQFHDPEETSHDIVRLRTLHVELDQAVSAAYGWSDLDLGHGFQETKQGVRYTISDSARRTVLDKLLELNHQRYAEEVAAGLHDKKTKKATGVGRGRKAEAESSTLELL